jgi:polysaccharide biosynthesis protein PslA
MFFSKKINLFWYVFVDWLAAICTCFIFYAIRKDVLLQNSTINNWLRSDNFIKILMLLPLYWIIVFSLSAFYQSLYKKSRLTETSKLLFSSFIGNAFIFLFLFVRDNYTSTHFFISAFLILFVIHFLVTATLRLLILWVVKWQIIKGKVFFTSILLGDSIAIQKIIQERKKLQQWDSYKLIGYICDKNISHHKINQLGTINESKSIIDTIKPDEVILAFKESNTEKIKPFIANLLGKNISIKVMPHKEDFITGAIKTNNILSNSLIEINNINMPEWQQNIKVIVDFFFAFFLLIILSPLLLYMAIRTSLSSKGNVFYTQERIGKHGIPFIMYKYRSMHINAEENGPQLSKDEDNRITQWGKTMRKWRLDELPQLWNIIKGDMSFIGYRPERSFYANQIIKKNPYYKFLYELKPGLTSWGMVKFGYAENIEQMEERMQYDLLYAHNASLYLDVKIMLHTLRIILLAKGK